MPYNAPDFRYRAQLTEMMDEPCSREQLRACLRDLALTNRLTMACRPLLRWLDTLEITQPRLAGPLHILDVGCGYGDSLRRIERWAKRRGIAVELTGLDLNPDAAVIAADASPAESAIQWVSANVFYYTPRHPIDLVVSSLFTHHLNEDDIVRFLQWMERHAQIGWFINDLSRAPIPYHFFRIFSKLARLHPFVQHDGPVSIARAFRPEEWRDLCSAAGLGHQEVQIQSFKPARLCVARLKPQSKEEPQ
jgi:SAM-dependent methyltransferase